MNALGQLAKALERLKEATEADPLATFDPTHAQWHFLHEGGQHRYRLMRAGNQIGKTICGAWEAILICLGRHPHQRAEPPVEVWILFDSRHQSIPLQEKLWDLAPKEELAEDQRAFNPVTGLGHHEPSLRFKNGSIIRIKTIQSGGKGLMGGSPDHILIDEPPTAEVWSECISRVRATGGTISLTMTPVNRDCTFIRELTLPTTDEQGNETAPPVLADFVYPLTVDNLTHHGSGKPRVLGDGTIVSEEWIASVRRDVLPWMEPVVCDGEWDQRAVDGLFAAFVNSPGHPDSHVTTALPKAECRYLLGVDHGTATGNQVAVLVAVEKAMGADGHPIVWVLDEAHAQKVTTAEMDAHAILDMLDRNGLSWHDLDEVWGDIPAGQGSARKGNRDLGNAIAKRLRKRGGYKALNPPIRTAKRGKGISPRGAVRMGVGWLHRTMVRPGHFQVHVDAAYLIESIEKYSGASDDDWSHAVDALRYGLRTYILGRHTRQGMPRLKVR